MRVFRSNLLNKTSAISIMSKECHVVSGESHDKFWRKKKSNKFFWYFWLENNRTHVAAT